MGQILHGCAKTTQTIRRAIQNRKESIAKLSKHYNLNPKTIIKWRKRSFTKDADMGPKHPRSTVLTLEEEAIIVTFRKYTLLPLDDCLYALQSTIPHLTRSSLHRCLQRHNISRLPTVDGEVKSKKKFKQYPIGYFHIDIAEVRTEEGKLHLFVAIDRTSKFTYVELCNSATKPIAAEFLRNLIRILPYKIHTILTDNGIQFTNQKRHKYAFQHIFDRVCEENVIEHRLTKVSHPWTNGQVERMNKTLKDATVKKYYYQSHQQLKEHLYNFVMAYNYAKRLKTLKGLTPYEFICYQWTQSPELFILNPHHHTLGPYIFSVSLSDASSAETLFGILSKLLRTTLATLNASRFTSSTATSSPISALAFASRSLPRSISFFIRVFSNIVERLLVFSFSGFFLLSG